MAQTIVIPASLEQRVSWKTTLDAIVLTAGVTNPVSIQLTPVVTDATPGAINAAYYRWIIHPLADQEEKKILWTTESIEVPAGAKTLDITIDAPTKLRRGYYLFQLILEDAEKKPTASYNTYVSVNNAIDILPDNPYMSLESVRTQFADISFQDNRLLDSQEIGTWDICEAVKRTIEQWNNTAPRLRIYTGDTFPYPEILRRGVIYMLLQTLCTMLNRNRMTYAAGNASVDLEQRVQAYQALLQEYRAIWIGGMAQAKNEENLSDFYGSIGYY